MTEQSLSINIMAHVHEKGNLLQTFTLASNGHSRRMTYHRWARATVTRIVDDVPYVTKHVAYPY